MMLSLANVAQLSAWFIYGLAAIYLCKHGGFGVVKTTQTRIKYAFFLPPMLAASAHYFRTTPWAFACFTALTALCLAWLWASAHRLYHIAHAQATNQAAVRWLSHLEWLAIYGGFIVLARWFWGAAVASSFFD
jgi:hypothetical protein